MNQSLKQQENVRRFDELAESINRPGMDELMAYLRTTDFYTAPSSTRFHLSCEGGLLQHSLNVYDCLYKKKESPFWSEVLAKESEDTLKIVALFHDLCKCGMYVKTTRNQKTYEPAKVASAEPWQIKHDSKGSFIWETVDAYDIDDQMPLGHGEKSVMILSRFIQLEPQEVYAIRWHMGFSEPKENYNSLGKAIEKFPLVLALMEADMEAASIIEDKDGNKNWNIGAE